jgi:hypothetical protein
MTKRLLWGVIVVLLCVMPVWSQYMTPDEAYQEALRRIEAARVSGATELDLSTLGLKELPPEIGQLTALAHLTLYVNQLTSLPPEVGQLENLISLSIRSNQLTSLPPEIVQLKNLMYVDASNNQFKGLPPEIGQLVHLKELDVSRNLLTSLPSEISRLKDLNRLDISNNPLLALPLELGSLSNLYQLETPALTFPPPEVTSQGTEATLAYLRDYEAMQARQTLAAIAGGVGTIAGVLLAFRWRQRREQGAKKKRL